MNRSTYHKYPFLTTEEFAEACHHLDSRYCQATLGPFRKRWKLRVHRALDMTFAAESGYATYLQITRPLDETGDLGDLESYLSSISIGTEPRDSQVHGDAMSIDVGQDPEELLKQPSRPQVSHVRYEVHLHPTYQAPCLWFSLHSLPVGEPALDIDTVFRRLVPDQFKSALRGLGSIGGISADHHPVTGVPAFFVHPCFLGDAMAAFDCAKEDYLMVWLGLVGGCVGLWVPRELVSSSHM